MNVQEATIFLFFAMTLYSLIIAKALTKILKILEAE